MYYDASTDNTFKLFCDTQTAPTTTVNESATGYTLANLNIAGLTTTGNVGIGIANTTAPLVVQAQSNAVRINLVGRTSDSIGELNFAASNGTNQSSIQSRTTDLRIKTLQNIPLTFHTNNTERMRVLLRKRWYRHHFPHENLLHISSSSDYDVVFDNTSQEKFRLRHGTSGIYLTGPNTNTLAFGVDQNHDVRMFNTSGSAYATFDGSTSRVGIGTTSPGTTLDVNGDIRAIQAIYSEGSSPRVQLQDTDGTNQF